MPAKVKSQIHMDDVVVRNAELESLLEERQVKKDANKAAAAEYKSADETAKEKLQSLSEVPPYRVGRFIITRNDIAPKSVSFETAPSSRLNIKLVSEE